MERQRKSRTKRLKLVPFSINVIIIGFVGGMLFSLLDYFFYTFHFTKINPALILHFSSFAGWKETYAGELVAIVILSLLSIVVAFIYKVMFQRVNHLSVGVVFGVVLWVAVFFIVNPLLLGIKSLETYDMNTVMTSICLYILYGAFIGYSISYGYAERKTEVEHEHEGADPS